MIPTFRERSQDVRTVMRGSDPWFVLSDLCAILGTKNTTQASRRLDPDEISEVKINSATGPKSVIVVNEPGLYHLVLTSRSPIGDGLRHWMAHEVMPHLNANRDVPKRLALSAYPPARALRDELHRLLDVQEQCFDLAIAAVNRGDNVEAATQLRKQREAQSTINAMIDREPLPITRGVADTIRDPGLREALGLGSKHNHQSTANGYTDDVVIEPQVYRYPAQYAR